MIYEVPKQLRSYLGSFRFREPSPILIKKLNPFIFMLLYKNGLFYIESLFENLKFQFNPFAKFIIQLIVNPSLASNIVFICNSITLRASCIRGVHFHIGMYAVWWSIINTIFEAKFWILRIKYHISLWVLTLLY
jgi:hypothetical protein